MPYLSASAVVIHYEVALYQVYAPLPLPSSVCTLLPELKLMMMMMNKLGDRQGLPVSSLNCDRQQIVKFRDALRFVTGTCAGGQIDWPGCHGR